MFPRNKIISTFLMASWLAFLLYPVSVTGPSLPASHPLPNQLLQSAPQTVLFYDDFESGSLGASWSIQTTANGRVEVSASYPYTGTYSLLLDDSVIDSIYSRAGAVLTVDLSGQVEAQVSFWWREFGDEDHTDDGVFLSDDNGATWYQALSFNGSHDAWEPARIDLDAEAAVNALSFNDHFQIKFQFYDNQSIPTDGYAIDEVEVSALAPPTPASLPLQDGFESGVMSAHWLADVTSQGRVQVSSAYPQSGTYSLLLDDAMADNTFSHAGAVLTVDLTGQTDIELEFWWRKFSDENHPDDGVFVSDDWGFTWHPVLSFAADPTSWRRQLIDLDEAAAAAGVVMNDHIQIKFQFYDNQSITSDGYAIDGVEVRPQPSVSIASFPYFEDFESGVLNANWRTEFTNEGRIQVSSAYPYSGSYSLLLDDFENDSIPSLAAAILHIDLSGQGDVLLEFWWREFADEEHPEDGVFISADDGASWHKIWAFSGDSAIWHQVAIDLDQAAAASGLSLNDHFQIKFQFYDGSPITTDGYSIDAVRLRSSTTAGFPFSDGFESGELSTDWTIYNTIEGRVRVSADYPRTGAYSLLLDDADANSTYSFAAAILQVDLSAQSDVMLDFYWREFSDEDDPGDGVFISDDGGASWHQVAAFTGNDSSWHRVAIDIDAQAALAGLALNDHFQIKFQFYDQASISTDGYAIDDIQLRLNMAPSLSWPGDNNYEQDGLHPEQGDTASNFIYRIKYSDPDSDPPTYTRVHILKNNADINGSPFEMTCASGDPISGVICSYTRSGLDKGSDYTYYFTALDAHGNPAALTAQLNGPQVIKIYRVYLAAHFTNSGPPTEAPLLDPIDNPTGHYSYTVSWSSVNRATRYILEEDDNPQFSSPEIRYQGTSTQRNVSVEQVGTYYYRVKASNTFGETGWSNTEAVVVTILPPPCPQAGTWAGFTDEGYPIEYTVADTPQCEVTALKITARMSCLWPNWTFVITKEYFTTRPVVNREFEYYFSYDPNQHVERVSGSFNSQTEAAGTSFFMLPDPRYPGTSRFCVGGPDWTASN